MRRSPLNRGTKGLSRGKGLDRGKGLKRGTKRMKPESDKRAAERDEWEVVRAFVFFRDQFRCQARVRWPEVRCGGPLDPHHIDGRASREDRLDPDGIISVCRAHHDAVDDQPLRARELGLLR